MDGEILSAALEYQRRGMCIIPIRPGSKKAACRWRVYQQRLPETGKLRQWFARGLHYPAVILGKVSGGLVCRDFDTPGAYEAWARQHPEQAGVLPTVNTARGKHIYFRSNWQGFLELSDGELRGDSGHYCLLPPAVHPSGVLYEWLVPLPDGEVPLKDPYKCGLVSPVVLGYGTEDDRGIRKEDKSSGGGCSFDAETRQRIDEAIALTLPTRRRQRNRAVFQFARQLKGIPTLARLGPKPWRRIVREWHDAALPMIGTKPFEETWIDFLKGWPRVKYPANKEFMSMIHEQAKADPVKGYEDKRIGVLGAVCRELGALEQNGVFYLAARTAARLLEVSPMTASRWLFLLESDGMIQTVEKGGTRNRPRQATRFQFIGRRQGQNICENG